MKFSEFIQECRNILNRIGKENFIKLNLQLHDIDQSSMFIQKIYPAARVEQIGNTINIASGRQYVPLTRLISQAKTIADKIGGDPVITIAGEVKYILGYNSQSKFAIASYDFPKADNEDLDESILDKPQEDLDSTVWQNTENGYILTEEAERIIGYVADWAISNNWIPEDFGIHIIGSIASNQYSDQSDIDVHFYSDSFDFKGRNPEDINTEFKRSFKEFANENPELTHIGKYPVEVYIQTNIYFDIMSIGCYDVKTRKWLSGPEIKDTAFDPYSEYYKDDMKYVDDIINDIRLAIMETYEKCIVFSKSSDPDFKKQIETDLFKSINNADKMFKKIKGMRKVLVQPKSLEQALKMRKDRHWHIMDSAFKLLKTFGYISICKECQKVIEEKVSAEIACERILKIIQENLSQIQMISEDTQNIGGISLLNRTDAQNDIKAHVEEVLSDIDSDTEVVEVWLHGSRMRGDWKDTSDLDAVVFYKGSMHEDHMYNILIDEPYDVCGIPVDFNPIQIENMSDIEAYKKSSYEYDRTKLEESIGSKLKAAALAGMTMAAGLAPMSIDAAPAAKNNKPTVIQQAVSGKYKHLIDMAFQSELNQLKDKKIGNFSATNVVNILAWTLYGEANNQSLKGKNGVASVILNRAGGLPEKMITVVFNPDQFSMWNPSDKVAIKHNLKIATSDSDYTYKNPKPAESNKNEAISWLDCVDIAIQLVTGKFKSTIGNRNSYLNFELTKKKYPNSRALKNPDGTPGWYYQMTNKLVIDDHTFGYLPENDGYKMNKIPKGDPNATEYIVKSGDSLWLIAKMFDTTSKKLARLNNISVNSKLKIGQKIKLKDIPTITNNIKTGNIKSKEKNQRPITVTKKYKVKSGDTLWKIAKLFNTTVNDIKIKNGLKTDKIDVDQIIKV